MTSLRKALYGRRGGWGVVGVAAGMSVCLTAAACGSSSTSAGGAGAQTSASAGTSASTSSTSSAGSSPLSAPSSSSGTGSSASTAAGAGCAASAVQLTAWAWIPGVSRAADLFNKTHPGICVTVSNIGAGSPEYTKVADALKAGTGAPDVAEIEYAELPSFEITKNLVDLSAYGAAQYKKDFAPFAWQEATSGSAVYSMPIDSGPMAFYYNSALFTKYHLTPPTTYAQMATEAATLKAADPSAYFTSIDGTDIQTVVGLMAQDGAFPFAYDGGKNVTINFTGPKQTAFADYWQKLIDAKEVNTPSGNAALIDRDKGVDAAWLSPAWGPSYFAPDVKSTQGAWRASPLPQWQAGANAQAVAACSSFPVFTQSKHPKEAAEFVEWLTATKASWDVLVTPPSSLFPAYLPEAESSSFKNLKYAASGSSTPNVAYSGAETGIQAQQWPPFLTAALTDSTTFAAFNNGTETLANAFKDYQKQLVSYAQSEGFTVTQ